MLTFWMTLLGSFPGLVYGSMFYFCNCWDVLTLLDWLWLLSRSHMLFCSWLLVQLPSLWSSCTRARFTPSTCGTCDIDKPYLRVCLSKAKLGLLSIFAPWTLCHPDDSSTPQGSNTSCRSIDVLWRDIQIHWTKKTMLLARWKSWLAK